MESIGSKKKLSIIEESAANKKGIDLRILDIHDLTSISDYFVIVSGNSTPQVNAIAEEILEKMSLAGYEPYHKEGKSESRWIILDFEDVIVHIFHREEREFYSLERLWSEEKKDEGEEV